MSCECFIKRIFPGILVRCLVLGMVCCTPVFSADTVKVFILAGQSNMVGWSAANGLPLNLTQTQTDVLIYAGGEATALKANQWLNLSLGFSPDTNDFGPELNFGRTMADSTSDSGVKIALIKCARDGQDLYYWWRPPSSGGANGNTYNELVNVIHAALAALPPQYTPVIAGILWMQGEADGMNISWANAYEANLMNLIADLRKEVSKPDLPFIAGMIHLSLGWRFADIVRNAETNVANKDSTVGVFETQDLSLGIDSMHYQTDAMVEVGKRFALTTLQVMHRTANKPPLIDAGPRQITVTANYPAQFNLTGSAVDDGNPVSPLELTWEKVSGPGAAVFGNSSNPVTTVTLSQAGTYHLRFSAFDGAITSMDAVIITADTVTNLALTASACSTSFCSPWEILAAINDDVDPTYSFDNNWSAYGNSPQTGTQWVQYNWTSSITPNTIDVYWYTNYNGLTPYGVRFPDSCVLKYWDGVNFIPVTGVSGYGVDSNRYNTTIFDEVTTTGLRLEFAGRDDTSTGILEWKVYHREPGSVKPRPATISDDFTVSVTGNRINIVLPRSAKNKPVSIRLYSTSGRMVKKVLQEDSRGGSYSIGLDFLKAAGLYCAEIRYGKELKTAAVCRIQ